MLTPQLPPDARRRHKPPSKGAILEPKWLPWPLSLSVPFFPAPVSIGPAYDLRLQTMAKLGSIHITSFLS